jgi:DNA-binding transcriptional LysR family regulator
MCGSRDRSWPKWRIWSLAACAGSLDAAAIRSLHALALRDLVAWPIVCMDTQSSVRDLVDLGFGAEGLAMAPAFEVTYMSTAVGLVRAGLGVAILPATAFELESAPGLGMRPVAGARMRRSIGVARKSSRSLSPAARIFLAALRKVSRARPRRP